MYALVDCNNFFVSCERVFQPQLEGRAVVVLSNNDGCVVARSNESKAMGIRMGTPFFEVKHLVDKGQLVVCSSNYALYGDMSARVMSILASAAPQIEVYSIDEAFLVLGNMDEKQIPGMCSELVRKVRKWTGMPVSIGIARTKTLAKIASHFAKKYKGYHGVCMIDTDEKRRKALELTPIEDVWGVGRRLGPKLRMKGVDTALDYTERSPEWVRGNCQLPGLRTWMELNEKDCIEADKDSKRKSICTSRSFADMLENEEEISQKIAAYAAQCAHKLRKEGGAALDVTAFLYTNRFREDLDQYFPSATIRLLTAANNTPEIVQAALQAFRMIFRSGYKYKKAGVIVDNIVPADAIQASLFDYDPHQRERNDRISEVMDKVNSADSSLLRLASQKEGHYASDIRREHCSRLYSTTIEESIEVK